MTADNTRQAAQRVRATEEPASPKHAAGEYCYYCAPDHLILRGITAHDAGDPYEGPTIHMQTPMSFCPEWDTQDGAE